MMYVIRAEMKQGCYPRRVCLPLVRRSRYKHALTVSSWVYYLSSFATGPVLAKYTMTRRLPGVPLLTFLHQRSRQHRLQLVQELYYELNTSRGKNIVFWT